MKYLKRYSVVKIFFVFMMCVNFHLPAHAQVMIDITGGNFDPIPVAITDFLSSDDMGSKIASVMAADLERSGLFQLIDQSVFLEKAINPDVQPQFHDWQQINAQGLVTGRILEEDDGRLRVQFRLWDIYGQKQLEGMELYSFHESWRRISHIIADIIYQKLTGENGYFDTRIVFIDETGPWGARVKKLAIMDQDGANLRYLSDGQEMVLTPRFSPTRQEITYMAFSGKSPKVYLQQIEVAQRDAVGTSSNMSIAPRFSPDGHTIAMSLLHDDGSANIYTMDLRSRVTTRLTKTSAIDTAASYSPDGRKIVFETDREGRQQIYVMNVDGSEQHRISSGIGSYSTPVWSPRGDYIAFTKQYEGKFAIGIMHPDGSGERILTSSFHNEGPTWSPNGRVIMFFRKNPGEEPKIYTIDIIGRNERQLPTPHGASDPAWSPLLN